MWLVENKKNIIKLKTCFKYSCLYGLTVVAIKEKIGIRRVRVACAKYKWVPRWICRVARLKNELGFEARLCQLNSYVSDWFDVMRQFLAYMFSSLHMHAFEVMSEQAHASNASYVSKSLHLGMFSHSDDINPTHF